MFSIVIPTWNNLDYVKLCVESIRKNSTLPHEIILHVNDGSDGTLQWAKEQGIAYTHTPANAGICVAVNTAACKSTQPYIVYMNDDMYCCPGWDAHLMDEINQLQTDCFLMSATLIEPVDTNNKAVIVASYGQTARAFNEAALLADGPHLHKDNWLGSSWPPTVVHKRYWAIAGGYSIEFSPGMSSDDDFAMKMWKAGCRIFLGIGKSKVYHFQTKSTGRVQKNNGRKQFLAKWGILQSTFNKYYIRKGETANTVALPEPVLPLKERLKIFVKRLT